MYWKNFFNGCPLKGRKGNWSILVSVRKLPVYMRREGSSSYKLTLINKEFIYNQKIIPNRQYSCTFTCNSKCNFAIYTLI